MIRLLLAIVLVVQALISATGQQLAFEFNGKQLIKDVSTVNRDLVIDKLPNEIVLNLDFEEGLVWVRDIEFKEGIIEVDLKGENVYQHSFLGIAFNGVNDTTYESVYFRPFQFKTEDLIRKKRGVQYVAMPKQTWQYLRKNFPGIYEQEVPESPDPNDWFHARFVVKKESIQVYVNQSTKPCLDIKRLENLNGTGFGLFVADQSGGSFRNLKITTR